MQDAQLKEILQTKLNPLTEIFNINLLTKDTAEPTFIAKIIAKNVEKAVVPSLTDHEMNVLTTLRQIANDKLNEMLSDDNAAHAPDAIASQQAEFSILNKFLSLYK